MLHTEHKISNIYIGGWLQRTMLQLSEIYSFVRGLGSSLKKLDNKKLNFFLEDLEIAQVDYRVAGEEYIHFSTKTGISIKIFEDGLITLNKANILESNLSDEINTLQNFYDTKLSPALSYLFSLGAPTPKELAGIKTVYPSFVVYKNISNEHLLEVFSAIDQQKYFEFKNDKYNVVRGDKYYFINNKTKSDAEIERYIEEQIFIREFKGQLHRYLDIHRIVWEKIDAVKSHSKIQGSEIVKFTTKLESYAKTVNLIDGRIKQMSTYLPTREKIAKEDKDLAEFLEISGYRYETLRDTLLYIQHLWDITRNYVESTQKQFEDLKTDISNRSIKTLTAVSGMGAAACIFMLLQSFDLNLTSDGALSLLIIFTITLVTPKILSAISNRQKYDISDVKYDKNIK